MFFFDMILKLISGITFFPTDVANVLWFCRNDFDWSTVKWIIFKIFEVEIIFRYIFFRNFVSLWPIRLIFSNFPEYFTLIFYYYDSYWMTHGQGSKKCRKKFVVFYFRWRVSKNYSLFFIFVNFSTNKSWICRKFLENFLKF